VSETAEKYRSPT